MTIFIRKIFLAEKESPLPGKLLNRILYTCIFFFSFFLYCCSDNTTDTRIIKDADSLGRVIFVELGSVNCDACKKMKPVMDSIQKKYGDQILVKFIDALQNPKEAEPYKIKIMPTQVFLDTNYIEFFRHEGFYAEDSIHKMLQKKGLKIII